MLNRETDKTLYLSLNVISTEVYDLADKCIGIQNAKYMEHSSYF